MCAIILAQFNKKCKEICSTNFNTGNFSLHVLNLDQLDNALEEERSSERYLLAQLFRATTWEGAVCRWHMFSADRTGR